MKKLRYLSLFVLIVFISIATVSCFNEKEKDVPQPEIITKKDIFFGRIEKESYTEELCDARLNEKIKRRKEEYNATINEETKTYHSADFDNPVYLFCYKTVTFQII